LSVLPLYILVYRGEISTSPEIYFVHASGISRGIGYSCILTYRINYDTLYLMGRKKLRGYVFVSFKGDLGRTMFTYTRTR